MSGLQATLADAVVVLETMALGGLFLRRRHRLCWSFAVYLAVLVIGNRLVTWWPETFFTLSFWAVKETAYAILKLAIAVELASRAFQRFEGATPTLRRTFLAVLSLTIVVALWIPRQDAFVDIVGQLQPRVAVGAVWLFVLTAVLATWYRIPLHEFHRALLVGFVPYLLVFSLLMSLVTQFDQRVDAYVGYADQVACCVLMTYWCVAAWRREGPLPAAPHVVRALQPWR